MTDTGVPRALRVMVYSHDPITRRDVIGAIGRLPDPDVPELSFLEVATGPMALSQLDAAAVDVAILDGEATPQGGLGLAKQMRDEYDPCPPIMVLVGRADDRWLADWSRADAVATHPVDPLTVGQTFVEMLRSAGLRSRR